MVRLNDIIACFIIFWCGGWSQFLPLTLRSVVSLGLGGIGFLYALLYWKRSFGKNDLILLFICIVYPIVASIRANSIWGQPFIIGLLSLRDFLNILFVYYLFRMYNAKNFFNVLCRYQIVIMILDAFLLYVCNIDNNRLLSFLPSDENAAYEKEETVENMLRGARLELGSGLTWLTLAYWSAKNYYSRNAVNVLCIILTFLFVIFVSKSRVSLVVCSLIVIMPLLFNLSLKNILKLSGVVIVIAILLVSLPSVSQRFLVIFDLFGETKTQGTGDFSGVARLSEILVAIPYILQHPILGVGNVSYHFKDGFSGVLNEYFFIADIGIVGMLFMGGVFLCYLYFSLFRNTYKYNSKSCDGHIRLFIRIISVIYIIIPFMGFVPLLANNVTIALILYLSYSKSLKRNANSISC